MSIWNPENLSSWIVKIEQGTRYTTPRLTNLYAAFGLCLTLSNNTIRFRSPRDIGGRRCSGLRNYELGGLKNIITGETHHAVAHSYFHADSRFDSGIKNACAIKGAQDNVVNLAVTLTKYIAPIIGFSTTLGRPRLVRCVWFAVFGFRPGCVSLGSLDIE